MKRSFANAEVWSGRRKRARSTSYYYESKQTGEEPLTRVEEQFICRYAYGRAAESVMMSERGQDFMAFAIDRDVCRFVLCDGVGLSYRGDVASQLLGRGLMGWLHSQDELSQPALERKLLELTQEAEREMRSLSVDPKAPKLLREVLEEKQRMGSEAMYVCGRIELPTRFRRKGRLWLAWQGDSRLRLWQGQHEISPIFGDRFRTGERWSSKSGPVGGKPHVYQCRLEHDSGYRLQMYSDGLNDLDPMKEPVPDDQVQVLMNALHTGGLEDDASFLEIMW